MIETPSTLAASHAVGVMRYDPQFIHTFVLHNGAICFMELYTFGISYTVRPIRW
jgi:hypothetical protein